MVFAVASLASLMMSAALFGRRSKKDGDGELVGSSSGARVAPSGPNVFAPSPEHGDDAPKRTKKSARDSKRGDAAVAAMPTVDGPAETGGNIYAVESDGDGLIGGPLLAELEARIHSNDPAPHPVRPQEMWHPGVTPLPVDLPPPPTEERIDQAELEGSDNGPGRFRFNRLRRVSPGEAPDVPVEEAVADVDGEKPVGDVLFGELFTSDRIPAGTEGLGSGAAPLVPATGGASGSLINGPVGRNARSSPRGLHRTTEVLVEHVDEPGDRYAGDGQGERPGTARPAPSDDSPQGLVDGQASEAVEDHHADPVVEPTDAAEQSAEPPQPQPISVAADGAADLDDTSLRFAPEGNATAVDHGSSVSVSVVDGWCWAALGDEARPIEVEAEGFSLQCPVATTALVAIDDTGRFVVVVRGEAALSVGGRRIRLRSGAMAFLPHGSDEAQVDVASEIEIAADPLVALNLDLDAKR